MANFTSFSSSSSTPPPPPSFSYISAPSSSSSVFDDDSVEDSCSICLESFSVHDPSTVTCCKHEYHLHCILEWSQRSKECPICWQSLSLKDPASQELLVAVEAEKCLRSRNNNSSSLVNSSVPFERFNGDHDASRSDDVDFDEQIMQHLYAAARRARFIERQRRQGSSGAGPSEVSGVQPTLTTSLVGSSSPTTGLSSTADLHPEVARNISPETDVSYRPRVLYSPSPPQDGRKLNTSEVFSLPESIKSKLTAASARYKESISKSTRGLKEKLLARNVTVKELSKGVQREMNAGIAGVSRMIERLELASKRSNSPIVPVRSEGTSGFRNEASGGVVHNVSSVAPSHISSPAVVSRMEIPPRVQNGHDAVKI
ncbi:E3 ubiquitin-protein ligase RHF1A-like [Vicia villosa]|uniref:E3 ubiquitin-protein ligase RHF1A-like n=1 Tax=Vicia villosa TaxID=3911 RepID=UPI00273AE9D4|nr:E3 ubiquitin-protein ligase RHF1A-like [Vicia villosa]